MIKLHYSITGCELLLNENLVEHFDNNGAGSTVFLSNDVFHVKETLEEICKLLNGGKK